MKYILCLLLSFSVFADGPEKFEAEDGGQSGGGSGIIAGSGTGTGARAGTGTGTDVAGAGTAPMEIPAFEQSCVFSPPMSREDRDLMTRAQAVINSLREDPNCRLPAPEQLTTLTDAVAAFEGYSGIDSVQGTPGSGSPLNCLNYESTLDRRFDQFVRNIDGYRLHFPRCTQDNRDEAIECAMGQVASEKSRQEQSCAEFRANRTAVAQTQAMVTGYQDVIGILTGMIENRNCGNREESTRENLLNLGLNLAGRASSFIPISGGQVLISGVTQLAQVAIRAIFGSRENNLNDPAVRARKTENFRNLACAYQEVEKRAMNCDRIIVRDNMNRMEGQYQQDLVTCGIQDSTSSSTMFDFMNSFGQISSSLRPSEDDSQTPPEPTRETRRETIAFLRSMSEQNIPGTDESFLEVGLESADRVKEHYDRIADDETYAREYLASQGRRSDALEIEDLRLETSTNRQNSAEMASLLREIQNAIENPANLDVLHQRMASFQRNFREAYAQTLQESAALSGSLSDQIDASNGSVEVLAAYGRIEEYRNWRSIATSDDDHGRDFETRLQQMQPHLRTATRDFLEMSRIGLSQVSSENLRAQGTRQDFWEDQIKPALLACNNLRSGMVEFPNFRQRNATFNATSQEPICASFNCNPNGIKTFQDHLQANNLSMDPSECNMGDCKQEFNRYLCRVDEGFDRSMDALKNEFLNTGRVCNNTPEQMASRR